MAKISFISLGCDKNLVDSEVMIGLLNEKGHIITGDEQSAEVIVINTCCFIEDALVESINTIIELGPLKNGALKAIVATGCLTERYREEIFKELPEVDVITGAASYEQIAEAVDSALLGKEQKMFFCDISAKCDESKSLKRQLSTLGSYYAYLKIAEGCDNHCTYCVIPSIRGKYRSRTLDSLVEETKALADCGVKELILVAQDTSRYGIDIYGKIMLVPLLERLSEIQGINWIRLMYCYPENVDDTLINTIASNDKICNYIDMPIQHISNKILGRMGRKTSGDDIKRIINTIRGKIEGVVIRTSLITGFPGETEEDFNELLDFVKQYGLERIGVFPFSREKGTPAYKLKETVNKRTRIKRKNVIMKEQKNTLNTFTKSLVGKRISVIVEGRIADSGVYVCRGYMDAPTVDGYVFVEREEELLSGDFIEIEITGYKGYDLWGI